MKVLLSPWRSKTPRALAKELGLRLRCAAQLHVNKRGVDRIVNWGTRIGWPTIPTLNSANAVHTAACKLACVRRLSKMGVPTLEWTVSRETAAGWLANSSVVAHINTKGHSGHGLVLVKKGAPLEQLPFAPLYTRYFPKKTESRVHVIKTKSGYKTFYLEKKRVKEDRYKEFGLTEPPTTYIRTYDNGWIFAREVQDDPKAIQVAIKALDACGLDFGAIDVMTDGKEYVVGEVNTAPGLEGECLQFYVDTLKQLI